ncbi:hypothetical protein [Pedobacter sp. KLB.chiD]|uniref:hypothetical protein n=1 Tax=Pedobacter sp. KLB.chiD TaxID=3387402 RepID=UPI00399AA401
MFYKIQHSLNNKIVGNYCQIEEAILPPNWDSDPDFIDNISLKKIDSEPKMPIGILHKKAKLTALLSAGPAGFSQKLLVSTELKNILNKFGDNVFQFFKCEIQIKNLNYEYWLTNPLYTSFELVDFKQSEVTTRKRSPEGGFYFERVDISTLTEFNDYLASQSDLERWKTIINRVNISESASKDIFVLTHVEGGLGYYISERVKQALLVHGITGIEFKPINLTSNEWLHEYRSAIYGKA